MSNALDTIPTIKVKNLDFIDAIIFALNLSGMAPAPQGNGFVHYLNPPLGSGSFKCIAIYWTEKDGMLSDVSIALTDFSSAPTFITYDILSDEDVARLSSDIKAYLA